jgi:two-component system OmpR family response regulator
MNGKLIFVVDDDPLVTTLVANRMEAAGCSVRAFAYGEECVAALDAQPDLVILDYWFVREGSLPKNGMEVFDDIHRIAPGLPVIMLSAQENGELVLELARRGIADYVIKDSNLIGNLQNAISEILHL